MHKQRFILISQEKLDELEMLFEHVYQVISDFKHDAEGSLNISLNENDKPRPPSPMKHMLTPEELSEIF